MQNLSDHAALKRSLITHSAETLASVITIYDLSLTRIAKIIEIDPKTLRRVVARKRAFTETELERLISYLRDDDILKLISTRNDLRYSDYVTRKTMRDNAIMQARAYYTDDA